MTYTLDWSETDLGGSAVTSYGSGALLDFTDKPAGATAALSITSKQSDGVDNNLIVLEVETTGSSVMTFDYKVSTESGWDKFHVDVDGVSQANWSGVVAWTSHPGISIPTAGTHTIRFRYNKDAGGAGNSDRVWIALLNITNTVTVNDSAGGTVDVFDLEDGAIPSVATTSTWTNSTSEPISGTRSLRSPAVTAGNGSYDLAITKPATADYFALGFDWKVSSEAGWDKLFIFPDASAANVPASGNPSTAGSPGWLEYSGSASGHLALILPPAETSILFRYTKDGSGNAGSDAAWVDNIGTPATGGGGTTPVTATRATTWDTRSSVMGTRATSWDVRTPATATRATSWNTLRSVAVSRAATWDARQAVAATRSTSWDTAATISRQLATSWDVTTQVTTQRATSWNVDSTLASVTATRDTTWRTLARPTATRGATWATKAAITAARAGTWDVRTPVSRAVATTWDARALATTARATSWRTLAAVLTARATSWDTESDLVPVLYALTVTDAPPAHVVADATPALSVSDAPPALTVRNAP